MTVREVNGVFKGGGAKGIAYAGALHALEERGIWFKSVAGASAGAVTAALVASGMTAAEVEVAVPSALRSANASKAKRIGEAMLGRGTSIFESSAIREWLDSTLRDRIHATGDAPVSFAALYAATGIELYVVAMDLATNLPVVFCRRTTPHVDVAGAVAASSAIPGAFPAGRGVFVSPTHGSTVHALVDGGTWANFPSFVFQDNSFRAWLRAASEAHGQWSADDGRWWDDETKRPMIGCILGGPARLEDGQIVGMLPPRGPQMTRRFDAGPTYTSPKTALHLLGFSLSSDPVRLLVVIAMATWVSLSLLTASIMVRRLSGWLAVWVPDWLYPIVLVGTSAMVVTAAVVAIGLVSALVLVGRLIADTLIPSMKASLGVATGVAPWIGFGNESVVLEVPFGQLRTVEFAVDDAARAVAVGAARDSVGKQLDDPQVRARLEALLAGARAPEDRPLLEPVPRHEVSAPDNVNVVSTAVVVLATIAVGGLAWWTANNATTKGTGTILASVLTGVVVGGAVMIYIGGRSAERANRRSRYGVLPTQRRSGTLTSITVLAGIALLAGGVAVSAAAMRDRGRTTMQARVLTGSVNSGSTSGLNAYTVLAPGRGQPIALRSVRHLRMGERIFIRINADTTATIVGALDDWRFGASIVLWMLGIGLLIFGARRRLWDTRCRRLTTHVEDLIDRRVVE